MPSGDYGPTVDNDEFVFIDPTAGTGPDNGSTGDNNSSGRSDRGSRASRSAANAEQSRKPGRPGSGAKKKDALLELDIKDILLSLHVLLAAATKRPELLLEETEAVKLQDAINRVKRHFAIMLTQKQIDISAFVVVVGEIYLTRLTTIAMSKPAATKPAEDNVRPFAFPATG
jgi:hypothetical protein